MTGAPGHLWVLAWYEGRKLMGVRPAIHVLTEMQVQRPIFTDSRAWEQKVTVPPNGSMEVTFTLSEK